MLFYVGTYSVRDSEGLYTCRFDPQSGAVTVVGSVSGGLDNLSYQALHPNGRFLYSVSETRTGEVASFALDSGTGLPKLVGHQSALGSGTCYVATDRKGKNVFIANYGSGTIAVLPIGLDGQLGSATAIVKDNAPSGVSNEGRQSAPHAHSIQVDPSDRFVVAADLGCDKLFLYRFDSNRGALAPESPSYVATKPGAGPRHFAFHPTELLLFAINELDSTIVSYRYDKTRGALSEIQTLSTLPASFNGKSHTAEIRIHPSGRFVYGSNRGHDSIAGFEIDGNSGRLNPVGHYPTSGKTPRNFAIDPAGKWLIAANQDTDNLIVFRIDPNTGRLSASGVNVEIPGPVCVSFAVV